MRWVAFSSVFAGLTGYLVIFLATSTLGAERFQVFNVFWGLFFMVYGSLQGLMHETTRGVRQALARQSAEDDPTAEDLLTEPLRDSEHAPEPHERVRPFRVSFAFGAVAAGLMLASSPLWAPIVLEPSHTALGIALLTFATGLAAVQAVFCGLVSGAGRWRMFGIFLTVEAFLRVLVALVAVMLADPIAGFMYATIAGIVMTPLTLAVSPAARRLIELRGDVRTREFVRRSLHAILAASAAAILVVGFPVLISAARPNADPVVIGNLLAAVTLTRAPVLTPITSFQNAIVVYFVDRVARGRRVVWVPVAIVLAVASIGAVLAWLIGPPIIQFMGPDFRVGGILLAALTFAAGFTGALYITGSAVLARERHGVYVTGWLLASAIALLLLVLVPGDAVATVLALMVGPVVGVLFHIFVGMRPGVGDAPAAPASGAAEELDPAPDDVTPER